MNLEQKFVTSWQRVPKHVCVVYADRVILSEITGARHPSSRDWPCSSQHDRWGDVTCSNPTGRSPIVTSKAHSTTKISWHSQLSHTTQNCINHFLINFDWFQIECGTINCAITDHLPIFACLKAFLLREKTEKNFLTWLIWKTKNKMANFWKTNTLKTRCYVCSLWFSMAQP